MRTFRNPKWFKIFFPKAIWDFSFKKNNSIYLTFDDGPNIETTPILLKTLNENNVKASFFCLGEEALKFPSLIHQIQGDGHLVAAHGMKHISGLKTNLQTYIQNTVDGLKAMNSNLFRPPYGKITIRQYKELKKRNIDVVMWSVMAYDFDSNLDSKNRIATLKKIVKPGDIIVFHDNHKSIENVVNELPELIQYWKSQNLQFELIKK